MEIWRYRGAEYTFSAYLCYSLTEKMSDAAPKEPVGDEVALYQGHQSLEAHIICLPQHALLSHLWGQWRS